MDYTEIFKIFKELAVKLPAWRFAAILLTVVLTALFVFADKVATLIWVLK